MKYDKELTSKQQIIFNELIVEGLTIKQIAQRHKITRQAIYKIVKKLLKKGIIKRTEYNHYQLGVYKNGITQSLGGLKGGNFVRLHNQKIRINLLEISSFYKKYLEESNVYSFDENTVLLYPEKLVIHTKKSFFGKDADECKDKSLNYWNSFFVTLENDLKVSILKNRKDNIKIYHEEYAELDNEIAQEGHKEGESIKIPAREDGKIWFKTDKSFNVDEAETIHPQTSNPDMQDVLKPFMNSLRDTGFTIHDLVKLIGTSVKLNLENADNLSGLIGFLKIVFNVDNLKKNEGGGVKDKDEKIVVDRDKDYIR